MYLGSNDICPKEMIENHNVSCNYIIGCNYSGCSYKLTSTNSNVNGSIIGKYYEIVNIDVNTQYNLTVSDINGDQDSSMEFIIHSSVICSKAIGNPICIHEKNSIDWVV